MPASHPHFVAVPDATTAGVRSYREPAEPHPLQLTFLHAEDQDRWVDRVRSLLTEGRTDEADALLAEALEPFDGALARLCKALGPADVTLEGWDDLLPILDEWEGPSITAITLGLTNPPDLVFDPGQAHAPELLLSLYSDEAFSFSTASIADVLTECVKDEPGWMGAEEDVEFYCEVAGLEALNTALIAWKHRYFLRDGRDGVEGRAPGGYCEFVAASWLLVTRFLQAVQRAPVPKGCRLITGAIGIRADFVTVLGDRPRPAPVRSGGSAQPEFATLTMKPWVPKDDPTADAAAPLTLRQRVVASEPVEETAPPSFLSRLFGRFRRP